MKGNLLKAIALFVDVAAPLTVVLLEFPVWVEKDAGTTVSGVVLILAVLCMKPLLNWIVRVVKTPSSWLMWLLLLCIFVALSKVSREMIVISAVGLASNLVGAFLYKLGDKLSRGA